MFHTIVKIFAYYFDFNLFFLIFFRLAPLTFLPFFTPPKTLYFIRIPMALLLSLYFYYSLYPLTSSNISIYSFVGEFLLGSFLYLIINIIFMFWSSLGNYISILKGGINSKISFINNDLSILGNFYLITGITLFFISGGHLIFFKSLSEIFILIPPGNVDISKLITVSVENSIKTTSLLFFIVFIFTLPFALTFFLIDMSFGIISRFYPSVNSYFISLPLKSLTSIMLILFTYFLMIQLVNYVNNLIIEIIIKI